jgi:hypothetical protein
LLLFEYWSKKRRRKKKKENLSFEKNFFDPENGFQQEGKV